MKKINRKGFTLIELLAVIVILGIILMIAVPSISGVIANSRRDSFVRTADLYIEGARNMALAGTFDAQADPSRATVISLSKIELEGVKDAESAKSPFNQKWNMTESLTFAYIVVINTRTQEDPKYTYYFTAKDISNNCIAMTEERGGKRDSVKADGCSIVGLAPTNPAATVITVDGKTFNGTQLNVYM